MAEKYKNINSSFWFFTFGFLCTLVLVSAAPRITQARNIFESWLPGGSKPDPPEVKSVMHYLYLPVSGLGYTAPPDEDYIERMDQAKMTETTRVLVEEHGPRHHDFYQIFVDDRCTPGGLTFPNHNLNRSSRFVFHILEDLGYSPIKEWLEDWHGSYNVIATKIGSQYPDIFIEVGAHVDSVATTPGASDNAGGLAAVIEMARVLKAYPNRHSIRFIAFVGEEQYLRGSRHHVGQIIAAGEKIKAGLIMDGIGWSETAPQHMNCLWDNGDKETRRISYMFESAKNEHGIDIGWRLCSPSGQWSDNYAYWEQGLPAVLSIGGFPYEEPNYHQCGDNMDSIDMENVYKTAQENLAVLLMLDAEDTQPQRVAPAVPILPFPINEGVSH